MAAVSQVLNRAARLLGKLATGSSLSTNEQADALVALNDMIDAWRLERLLVWALQEETLTLTNGVASKTIGPSGDLNTVRPVAIEAAWITDQGVTYPVEMMEEDEYDAINVKAMAGDWPSKALYRPTVPTGTLITWPVANATRTMKLVTRVPVSEFSAASDTITLPPGYRAALTFNLAIELASEYDLPVPASVELRARSYKAAIKVTNDRPLKRVSPLVALVGNGSSTRINSYPWQ